MNHEITRLIVCYLIDDLLEKNNFLGELEGIFERCLLYRVTSS